MTQETADRIFELMRDIRLWDAEHDALDHRAVARQIAAEIDTLAAKVKECDDNTDFVEGLREAERAALADTRQSLAVATVKIDALTRERDEARAEVAKLKEQNRVLATTSLRDVIKSVHPSGRARGQ